MELRLRISGAQYKELRSHLFPGDGLEAVALLICGRREDEDVTIFATRRVIPVPYDQCSVRRNDGVIWSTDVIDGLVGELWKSGNSIIKVHSHPTDYRRFSEVDDESDIALSIAWDGLFEEGRLHGSAVMLPDGSIFGRGLVGGEFQEPFSSVLVSGNDIHF